MWLDPFTYVDLALAKYYPIRGKKSVSQEIAYDLVYVASAFLFAFIAYSVIGLLLSTSSPFVIVMSGSMEPSLYRGDIVVLRGTGFADITAPEVSVDRKISRTLVSEYAVPVYAEWDAASSGLEKLEFDSGETLFPRGENSVVVYYSSVTGKQIIHRVLAKIRAEDGFFLLTKGDNPSTNYTFDQDCIMVPGTDSPECIEPYAVPIDKIEGKTVFGLPALGCAKIWPFDNIPSVVLGRGLPSDYRGLC